MTLQSLVEPLKKDQHDDSNRARLRMGNRDHSPTPMENLEFDLLSGPGNASKLFRWNLIGQAH